MPHLFAPALYSPGKGDLSETMATKNETGRKQGEHSFGREVLGVYGFPAVMFALAIIPGLNFTYSGHGGISWLLVPLCSPWVVLRALIKTLKGSEASRRWYVRFFKITLPSYVAIALPLSWAATTVIRLTYGLDVSTWLFFADMVSPFPWWYFSFFSS